MLRASQEEHDPRVCAIGINKCPLRKMKLSTYLSLNAPAVLPFPVTEMIASSKFHDEAASATPAPKSSNEGINERRNRIVELCCCRVWNSWSFKAAYNWKVSLGTLRNPVAVVAPLSASLPFSIIGFTLSVWPHNERFNFFSDSSMNLLYYCHW